MITKCFTLAKLYNLQMTLTLFLLAVLPPILIGYYVYQQDKYEKEPKSLIIKSFIFGNTGTII